MKPTQEQAAAIGSRASRLYVEAEPGSGKTAVAAARFGLQRYRETDDPRSVLALSFTRSATQELQARVRLLWGLPSLSWPHGVTTIDSLICQLVEHLLSSGSIEWPGGHRALAVADTWKGELPHTRRYGAPVCGLDSRTVVVRSVAKSASTQQPRLTDVESCVADGRCTHTDVRGVLEEAMGDPDLRAEVVEFFGTTTRALIVDEVFDGNELDLELVASAAEGGCAVTLVGDPWQALYEFRGATPKQVPEFVGQHPFTTLPLTASRRWRTDTQRELAEALRSGEPVELDPTRSSVDVVIGRWWMDIWKAGAPVLPLAFRSPSHDRRDAGMCLLLNAATQLHLGLTAAGVADAIFSLRLSDEQSHELRAALETVVGELAPAQVSAAYEGLRTALSSQGIELEPARPRDLDDIKALADRLTDERRPVPGLTAHQAKGREWDHVGLVLKQRDEEALSRGLSVESPDERAVYVACTRARCSTTVWERVP